MDVDAYLFGFFLSQLQVSSKLSLLSVLRLHDVQAGMNMRQALEATVRAAYTLKFPDENLHIIKKEDGTVEEKGNFKSSCHKWLETEYPLHSVKIKDMKDIINDIFMHANLITAESTFYISSDKYWSGLFDKEDALITQQRLWWLADLNFDLIDLISRVIIDTRKAMLVSDFIERMKDFYQNNEINKKTLIENPRFSRHL